MFFIDGKPVDSWRAIAITQPARDALTFHTSIGRGQRTISGTVSFDLASDETYAFMRGLFPPPEALEGVTMATNDRTGPTLRDEGWIVQAGSPSRDGAGLWTCTLMLRDVTGELVHAVTGQGVDAESAQAKAIEMANRWRRMQAETRSGEGE